MNQKVDYAIMHGAFAYQLPANVNVPTHDPDRYLSIVRKYIFIGHIHRHTTYDRILAQGSFDRLTHGEEEAKGHLRVTVYGSGGSEITFVENKGAKRYVTIDCRGLSVDDALNKIERVVTTLPDHSFTRVLAGKDDPITVSLDTLRVKYHTHTWSTKVETNRVVSVDNLIDLRSRFKGVELTKENVLGITLDRLEKRGLSPDVLSKCRQLLGGVL
jgi:hypothetical protein